MNKGKNTAKTAMQKAHEELSSYGSVSALDLYFGSPLQNHYPGIIKILKTEVLKTLDSFKFRASSLGSKDNNPNAPAYDQVLIALEESLAGMSRASQLDLDFSKHFFSIDG